MYTNKIREYIMVKDDFNHAKLEEIGCYDYYGELKYTDNVYNMLNASFKMDKANKPKIRMTIACAVAIEEAMNK